jgi:hypothetical protein
VELGEAGRHVLALGGADDGIAPIQNAPSAIRSVTASEPGTRCSISA